jgi:hypothetical protein
MEVERPEDRRVTMAKYTLALATAFVLAAALLPTAILAGAESHNRLAAPFSPNATIYRPDCWLKEAPTYFCNAGTGVLKDDDQ